MIRYTVPILLVVFLLAGLTSCKKNPVDSHIDTTIHKCDTCDTTHKHCDTCNVDTTHHIPGPSDTTSHSFTWTQLTIPGEAGLTGCWVFGTQNIYVVGGSLRKWDGTNWTDVSPTDAVGSWSGGLSGFSIFAFSEGDYWLTHSGTIIHGSSNTSTTYSFGQSTISGPLHSSWGTSSTNMYSVGDGGTILHFDGTSWTRMASGTTKDLHSIWGTGSQDIWASGTSSSKGTTILLHFDGTSWTEDPISLSKGGNATGGFDVV